MRTDGKRWYRVDVEVLTETQRGKRKRSTEQYLTLQGGVTEAEAAVVKNFKEAGDIREYRIKQAVETKILEVV